MKEQLRAFEERPAEIVFHWHDPLTEAKGWVVINSLRGGAAGGGTRMRKGLTQDEVLSLAKTMEIKFTVAGPAIGGAKSGIDFDPNDPRKEGVLRRWYRAIYPLLKNYYGTGGDLNVDQKTEVIPITSELGILHPQEGVLNGHYQPGDFAKARKIKQLQDGVSLSVTSKKLLPQDADSLKVGDMITGYGTAVSVAHLYKLWGHKIEGKRVIIQGWGNVASGAAFYLSEMGANIVGIIDKVGGLMKPDGFSLNEITALFNSKDGNELCTDQLLPFEQVNKEIWSSGAEVFIPAAASRLVTRMQLAQLLDNGLEIISSGANVPFADEEIFYGPIAEHADQKCAVIPDFISNCGMARVFGYLMEENAELTDLAIFQDVSQTILEALKEIKAVEKERVYLTSKAYTNALKLLI
ncbi:Glu/Leu/Phe/Val dehydrogenase dimerization domain-containing protein [Schleiferiaceae bacterium]|nr:Glu/Leu/Phe/Val dehydrogenase dimerization domain-containing protein [Schleiferiaceae bacterium]|tara:strand:- start:2264 stop:3490 length:1227 start_codon:yes stop_codon:yes gene_type:complete